MTTGGFPFIRRSVHCLPGVLLLLLVAVAHATPLEALHLKGIQDGGDYDSIIQPLVLSLAGLAILEAPIVGLLGAAPERPALAAPADCPAPAGSIAESRAPPLL
jgi:hypothetical protein